MAGELLGSEGVLAVGRFPLRLFCRIVIGVDDQLPFDLHRLIGLVVKVQAPAEASRGGQAGTNQDVGGPDGGHPNRCVVLAFDELLLLVPRSLGHPVGVDSLAT